MGNFSKHLTSFSSLAAALAGLMLILNGEIVAGFTAFCFSTLESIYYEIRWGHD